MKKIIFRVKEVLLLSMLLLFAVNLQSQNDKGEKYVLETLPFNSEAADFAAVEIDGATVFVSDKNIDTVTKVIKRYDVKTGRSFCDFYAVNKSEKVNNLLKKLNTEVHEGPLSITEDGNKVFFSRNGSKEKAGNKERYLQIYYLEYKNGRWGNIKDLPINSSKYNVTHPAINSKGDVLYFTSDMPSSKGGKDIYRTKYNAKDNLWGVSERLGDNVNTKANETFPFISKDGKLYFSSDEKGGIGGIDIYYSELKKDGETFSKKKRLSKPINSEADDFAYFEKNAEMGKKGFISSSRIEGEGSDDIYFWRFIENPLTVKGVIKDSDDKPIKNTDVEFILEDAENKKDNDSEMLATTDEKGNFEIVLERDEKFTVKVRNDRYYKKEREISTDVATTKQTLNYDITLEDLPYIRIIPKDAKSGKNIKKVAVKIDVDNKHNETLLTDKNGVTYQFPKEYRIGDDADLFVSFKKSGYVEKEIAFTVDIKNTGKIKLSSDIKEQFIMTKFKKDIDVTKLIGVKAIYYDFGSAEITDEAAKELDKVCEFLDNYPEVSLELRSHTDNRGSDQANYKLSDKRAKSAADYIQARINNPDQIYGRGYGENKPRHINKDLAEEYRFLEEGDVLDERFINSLNTEDKREQAHQLNRRTELIVTGVDETKFEKNEDINSLKVLFKVQILSSKYKIDTDDPIFKGHRNVTMYEENGRFKYTIGAYESFEQANELRKQLNKEFKGCFVVAFKNGKRISLSEARKY